MLILEAPIYSFRPRESPLRPVPHLLISAFGLGGNKMRTFVRNSDCGRLPVRLGPPGYGLTRTAPLQDEGKKENPLDPQAAWKGPFRYRAGSQQLYLQDAP